ncbi:MAG TPA: septal ring lytic transglycosylase RlpA family protein [Thermoanaerobaculia bacterium]|nr:septal ring lytic transglycosylase RlpA family protein [Thermoanaerobaculia bacterium]
MKWSAAALGGVMVIAYGCATAPKPQVTPPSDLHGVASWYGQEFAGRTTANGEIFDPLLFTAAHRTLPFGTVVDVQNPKSHQTVRVRINDRGPYIGGRMIDLSYAAAQQIGLIEPGSGEVDLTVVKLGSGEREPPAPYVVSIADVKPAPVPEPEAPAVPVVVDNVQVVTERQGVETRLQVSPDGRKVEEVPVKPAPPTPPPKPAPRVVSSSTTKYVVQVGAFAQEANAKRLTSQLTQMGQNAHIDSGASLFFVRIGPFDTRDQAIQARSRLENKGLSAIVIAQ